MNDRAKKLLGELMNEMADAAPAGPPTGLTRYNLNKTREAMAVLVATTTTEQEFDTAESIRIGYDFYKELQDAEVKVYTAKGLSPKDPMNWQDVRDTYTVFLQATIDAISPDGIAKRKAAMKARQEANVATPAANAERFDAPTVLDKMTPSLN